MRAFPLIALGVALVVGLGTVGCTSEASQNPSETPGDDIQEAPSDAVPGGSQEAEVEGIFGEALGEFRQLEYSGDPGGPSWAIRLVETPSSLDTDQFRVLGVMSETYPDERLLHLTITRPATDGTGRRRIFTWNHSDTPEQIDGARMSGWELRVGDVVLDKPSLDGIGLGQAAVSILDAAPTTVASIAAGAEPVPAELRELE